MYCNKCGNKVDQGNNFCENCGSKVENNINNNLDLHEQMTYANQNNQNHNELLEKEKNSTWKNTTSLVIGIISLVFVFIFQILTMPLSIVGIVFGIMSVRNNKKQKIGLILNSVSFIIAIPIFLLYGHILNSTPANPTVGTWDCKPFNNGYNEELDYTITMKLNNNNEFKWNKYNDGDNNYVVGHYEFQDLHKTNYSKTANYYSIKLEGDRYVLNGSLQQEPYKSEYEMGIIKGKNEAILMNTYSYNMYYCYRNDTSAPHIEMK